MEKITDKIAALPHGSNYFSLEFFPPKTIMGVSNLRTRLSRMSQALKPLFVTVTWGTGGSTAANSLELAELCQRELGLTTCLHLTCTNSSPNVIDEALKKAHELGIRNILALRGDPPRKEYMSADLEMEESKKFEWAIDLVKYIKKKYGNYFCVGVAAYPEGHADGNHPDSQSFEHDLPYLVEKVKAGADFIMTQLFFDTDAYDVFERRLREHESGCFEMIPIIPGLMPIQSYQMIKRIAKLTHVKIPPKIAARLDTTIGDDELSKEVGVDIVSEIILHIQQNPLPALGRRGFHLYTLNLEKAVSLIIERTSLIPSTSSTIGDNSEPEYVIVDKPVLTPTEINTLAHSCKGQHQQNLNLLNPNTNTAMIKSSSFFDVASPDIDTLLNSSTISASNLVRTKNIGSLGREATWDDFPNGRWGDVRSPAYGEIDGYGVSLHVSVKQAIHLWGYPQSKDDITSIFVKHVNGSLILIPWSDEGLYRESDVIKDQLLKLNKKGYWTIASQPAINGIRSSDSTFGWGPRNGFVFQKEFVEFFILSKDWESLKIKLQFTSITRNISWFASDSKGNFLSSGTNEELGLKNKEYPGNVNAVTWGVFPGKEIITPTIIEEVSFRTWAEEAFGIWAEWAKVYINGGPYLTDASREAARRSHRLIESVREEIWLVNIIHHGFNEKDSLWNFLLG
ncbi:Methylenetetrahydrofolate reductase [Erysiphe necator]|nr:Methylenetetrahydrofolate reductase [Erysiphe necator]